MMNMNMNLMNRLTARLRGTTTKPRRRRAVWQSVATAAGIGSAVLSALAGGPLSAQTGSITHGGQAYRVVSADASAAAMSLPPGYGTNATPGAPAATQPVSTAGGTTSLLAPQSQSAGFIGSTSESDPIGLFESIRQVGHRVTGRSGGCPACGQANCGGTCGVGGMGGYGECPTCEPFGYVIAEGLYLRNDSMEGATLSRNFALENPDFEPGIRVTAGNSPDCVSGSEVSFMGVLNWTTEGSRTFPNGLRSVFTRGTDLDLQIDDTLNGLNGREELIANDRADQQFQRYESQLWSVEASRTMIAWDVAKFLIGARYLNLDEQFLISGENDFVQGGNTLTERSAVLSETSNRLIGLQVGMDIFNPIGRFSSTYVRARAGAYLNLAEADVTSSFALPGDPLATTFSGSDNARELAGVFEIGSGIRYQLGEMLAIRGGGELMYLTGVATADSQLPSAITTAFNPIVNADADIFIIGFSGGIELKY